MVDRSLQNFIDRSESQVTSLNTTFDLFVRTLTTN